MADLRGAYHSKLLGWLLFNPYIFVSCPLEGLYGVRSQCSLFISLLYIYSIHYFCFLRHLDKNT